MPAPGSAGSKRIAPGTEARAALALGIAETGRIEPPVLAGATGPAETGLAEPADAEPPEAEPADAEPTDAEPTCAEPADAEPADAEPTDEEPTDVEPADAEPWTEARPLVTPLTEPPLPGELESPVELVPVELALSLEPLPAGEESELTGRP